MRPGRLQLDFIVVAREQRWLGLVLLLVALAVAADLGYRYREARTALARTESIRRLLPDERKTPPVIPKARLDEYMKGVQNVVHQLALPWPALVAAFEGAASAQVAVLQLQPEAREGVLRVTAEARDREAMLDYLRSLVAASGLSDVHLLDHQVKEDDPQRPILFTARGLMRRVP